MNIGWIIASVGTAVLIAVVGVIVAWRMRHGEKSRFPVPEERTFSPAFLTLGSSFVVLGIVFGTSTDRLIGYSFIGAGVLLSIIGAIKSRRREQRSSMEVR